MSEDVELSSPGVAAAWRGIGRHHLQNTISCRSWRSTFAIWSTTKAMLTAELSCGIYATA